MCERGHQVRVVDFEIGWRERRALGLLSARAELVAPPKVIEGSRVEVIRPAFVRVPLLNYAASFTAHACEIRRQLRSYRPDVILGLGLLNAFAGIGPARRARVPFIYYLIDELHRLVPEPTLQGLARVVEQANVRRATLVLSINQALRDYTIEMGALPERSMVLPAGVDIDRHAAAGDGSEIRNRHGLDSDDLVLFFMGWVYPFSGIREVAERLVAGEGREARVKLLVVGKGDAWAEIAQLVDRSRAKDTIQLVGYRPYGELPAYLAAADICILPAHAVPTMENIVPIKMYEYLAAGKPVIATRLHGLVKEFGEGHGVCYVDRPDQVVPKALELLRAGALDSLGQKGQAFVSANDWTTITDKFESYLKDLMSRPRRDA